MIDFCWDPVDWKAVFFYREWLVVDFYRDPVDWKAVFVDRE